VRVARLVLCLVLVACTAVLWPPAARSQSQPRSGPGAVGQAQARFQISVMEGVLEKAVENAARTINRQIQPMTPELLMFGTDARARGFRLEGYGVFFDVEVPMVRQSLGWAFQIIGPPDEALRSLRDHVRSIQDRREREQLDQALKQIELQFPARSASNVGGQSEPASAPAQPPIVDPNEAYTSAVTAGLMDAMLDYSGPLQIATDEWLSVAARDYEGQRGLRADAPYDLVTIVMRIRGGDLTAFRAGRLSRDEARKRIEVKEF
jgi:hypothetical protein